MTRRAVTISAAILVLATCVLAASGFYLQRYISRSFSTSEQIRVARLAAFQSLEDQLNEETGVRGFAATQESLFLEPYYNGRGRIARSLGTLERTLSVLSTAMNGAADVATVGEARRTNAAWQISVADPLLHTGASNPNQTELHGKQLVDRYRSQIDRIVRDLTTFGNKINEHTEAAIERVGAFIGAIILFIALAGLAFIVQQSRLSRRLEAARLRVEQQRRRSGELRASYEAEKRIADTLQEAFSQRPLPSLPMLRFSATYVPATEETKVGGDWYDAMELPEGRVLFAIGDVAGHGIKAAVTMNRARQSLISCALLDPEPASVLQRVNNELLSENATMVTALAGFADSQSYEFVYASAGHPPPVLLEPHRQPRLLEFGSLPLGVSADAVYRSHRVQSVPGAMLVLYTDGALEHSHDVLEGEAMLLAATAEAGDRVSEDPATVIHNAIFGGRQVGDDVAILTIGFSDDPASGMKISSDTAQATFAGTLGRSRSGTSPGSAAEDLLRMAQSLPKELAS